MVKNEYGELEKVIKAVANKRRLQIVAYLQKERGATVGMIAERIKLSFKSTSRHLVVLFSANIVDKDQHGLEMHYSLSAGQHSTIKHLLSIL